MDDLLRYQCRTTVIMSTNQNAKSLWHIHLEERKLNGILFFIMREIYPVLA